MKKSGFLALLLFLVFLNSSCIQQHQDPFYNDSGTYDSGQLPLIKPYYLIYIDEKYGWQMPLQGNFPQEYNYFILGDLLNVKKVSVENEVILVYSAEGKRVGDAPEKKVLHWFVAIPAKRNLEMGFEAESELLDYLREYEIREVSWVDPTTAYQEFSWTGCFDWIPDCK